MGQENVRFFNRCKLSRRISETVRDETKVVIDHY